MMLIVYSLLPKHSRRPSRVNTRSFFVSFWNCFLRGAFIPENTVLRSVMDRKYKLYGRHNLDKTILHCEATSRPLSQLIVILKTLFIYGA